MSKADPVTPTKALRQHPRIRRSNLASWLGLGGSAVVVVVLAVLPYLDLGTSNRLTELFVLIILATSWNLLAGFGGMVSVGQQAYIGIGAYSLVMLANTTALGGLGLNPFLSVPIAAIVCAIIAIPISYLAFRLIGGYFAVGTWVIAEIMRLITVQLPNLHGGSGESISRAMSQSVDNPDMLTASVYWTGLICTVAVVAAVVLLARSRIGLALTAVRDEPVAAATSGVNVVTAKRIVFIVAGAAAGLAGAVLAMWNLGVRPDNIYGVQWSAYMIFIVVIGGVGTIEGPILGALLFWLLKTNLGDYGPAYLIGLGVLGVVMVLFAPRGLWGLITWNRRVNLFPIGYRLDRRLGAPGRSAKAAGES